ERQRHSRNLAVIVVADGDGDRAHPLGGDPGFFLQEEPTPCADVAGEWRLELAPDAHDPYIVVSDSVLVSHTNRGEGLAPVAETGQRVDPEGLVAPKAAQFFDWPAGGSFAGSTSLDHRGLDAGRRAQPSNHAVRRVRDDRVVELGLADVEL